MLEDKKPKWIIVASIIGLVIIVMIGVVLLFTSKKRADYSTQPTQVAKTVETYSTTLVPQKGIATSTDLIKIIDKDSIFRSTDGGDSFSAYFKVSSAEKVGVANVLAITFHPLISGRIIVGSLEDGLFFKNAGEDIWNAITFPPKKIFSFILDKKDPDLRMFASGVVDGNGRIFRTSDGGESWRAVYVEPGQASTISALSQNQRNPDIIYSGTSLGTVIKSVDGGDTWRNVGKKIAGVIKFISFTESKLMNLIMLLVWKNLKKY